MQIKCETCGRVSDPRQYTEKLEGNVERLYFMCPACGRQETICYIDDGIRFLQRLQKAAGDSGNLKERERITKRIEDSMRKLKEQHEGSGLER